MDDLVIRGRDKRRSGIYESFNGYTRSGCRRDGIS